MIKLLTLSLLLFLINSSICSAQGIIDYLIPEEPEHIVIWLILILTAVIVGIKGGLKHILILIAIIAAVLFLISYF